MSNSDRNQHPSGAGASFRDDLTRRLRDPDFAAEYHEARARASLGLKIARIRTARGMSQTELAARLNTSQSVISRYESADYSGFRVETLRRLAEALGAEFEVDIREPATR